VFWLSGSTLWSEWLWFLCGSDWCSSYPGPVVPRGVSPLTCRPRHPAAAGAAPGWGASCAVLTSHYGRVVILVGPGPWTRCQVQRNPQPHESLAGPARGSPVPPPRGDDPRTGSNVGGLGVYPSAIRTLHWHFLPRQPLLDFTRQRGVGDHVMPKPGHARNVARYLGLTDHRLSTRTQPGGGSSRSIRSPSALGTVHDSRCLLHE
jgi:hypothetical protein